jgi:hypothetical protein
MIDTTDLNQWAIRHHVSYAAIAELQALVSTYADPPPNLLTEADAQAAVRVQATAAGWRLWRNNIGAGKLESGIFVRFGIANDPPALNKTIKSSDLIGIRPVIIQPHQVGHVFGLFVCREVKKPGWRFTGTEREVAQQRWNTLITAMGGDAKFTTGALL